MYHQIDTLLPENQTNPLFYQIYMYDMDEQQRYRQHLMPDLDSSTLSELQAMLHEYTTPTASEVAVLMVGSGQESECLNRDIILCKQGSSLHEPGWHPNIPIRNILYDQISNNMISHEQTSDNINIFENYEEDENSRHVTIMNYYAYHLQIRRDTPLESFALHRAGRLFQQYIVDAYACIEQSRLNYFRLNQKQIWAELYNGLQDTLT
ncbi:13720_t:CDS:2, partial [Acaulospora morrowiae]